MSEVENEKSILEQTPDFDNQLKILEDEHKENVKKRRYYILIFSILFLIVLSIIVSFSAIYHYTEYFDKHSIRCDDVNLKVDGSNVPNINITDGKKCVPKYNIDYEGNRLAMFSVDVLGDRSVIFNPVDQLSDNKKYCILNCDRNGDGWPDYNLDLNGDGEADINIVLKPDKDVSRCDLNCDLNFDTIPDINIDTDGDKIADINITEGNSVIPKYNIDYKGNRVPFFNVKNNNGINNIVTNVLDNPLCEENCDIDGDGWPDYNLNIEGKIINKLVIKGNANVLYNNSKHLDWKCVIDSRLKGCENLINVKNNSYINIDVDGDGNPDVNISDDNGITMINAIDKIVDGRKLNVDSNKDGFPDYNIDIDNDGVADINITRKNQNICIENCDTNRDGVVDYLYNYGDSILTYKNINIDVDYDGICDVNCDITYDLYPDLNLDVNSDNIPDNNIDYNRDKIIDFNIDDDFDGVPTENLDAYGVGNCNFNCNGKNLVNSSTTCEKNCDTNKDGWPDLNVDINNDGVCDFNCDNGKTKVDKDSNYFLDSEYEKNAVFDITNGIEADFYIMNPLDIKSESIEPGWEDKFVISVKNNTNYAIAYRLVWENVYNEFTNINNLDYNISKSNMIYINNMKAPRYRTILKDNQIIRSNSNAEFVLQIYFRETGINQFIDSGKLFKGQLKIELIK